MAGHSKWANIQHRKGRQDKIRGKIFTRIGKELTIAAREGGNPEFNPKLRLAIDKAKASNMSKDVMERAIKKGTGELEGVEYVEITYEGYGPAGVAFVVEVVTDNKNRSASSVRSNFARNDGNLGADGAVSWMFHKKGQIIINKGTLDTDDFMMQALEAGAEDIAEENDKFIITTEFSEFMNVKENLEKEGFLIESAELTMIPENNVEITDEEMATKVLKLYEALEENEDVQNIYANFEISDEIMEKIDN
ncbi:MAG: YebC/PmpR family DNA-binding transcriptional regulator [Fusobacteriaceae bacterium]|nr:YebC/PmpR family DNA-binding transcriptional regulator [Fusobacteriaceae bacterium]